MNATKSDERSIVNLRDSTGLIHLLFYNRNISQSGRLKEDVV